MKLPTIKQIMREDSILTKYEDGKLWYHTSWLDEDRNYNPFEYPIDTRGEDAAGTFNRHEKNIALLRWIRKHIELLTKAQAGDV